MTDRISRSLDALGLLAIGLVLIVAFADQLLHHERRRDRRPAAVRRDAPTAARVRARPILGTR